MLGKKDQYNIMVFSELLSAQVAFETTERRTNTIGTSSAFFDEVWAMSYPQNGMFIILID